MTRIVFPGRILFLCDDPAKLASQFAGEDLSAEAAAPLRSDISTDEITPIPTLVHYDEKIARFAHTGFETKGRRPIGEAAILEAKAGK